jgi:hypothetical protein
MILDTCCGCGELLNLDLWIVYLAVLAAVDSTHSACTYLQS